MRNGLESTFKLLIFSLYHNRQKQLSIKEHLENNEELLWMEDGE